MGHAKLKEGRNKLEQRHSAIKSYKFNIFDLVRKTIRGNIVYFCKQFLRDIFQNGNKEMSNVA
jgi:hypothetical protein